MLLWLVEPSSLVLNGRRPAQPAPADVASGKLRGGVLHFDSQLTYVRKARGKARIGAVDLEMT